ncbi:MAG: hypothetical protein AAGA56_25265 [Myxococcota bacterium]
MTSKTQFNSNDDQLMSGEPTVEASSAQDDDARERAKQKVDLATSRAGEEAHRAAAALRRDHAADAADRLDEAGNYLNAVDYDMLVRDIGDAVRRNPVPALLAGVGVGFLLGRVTS